MQAIPLTSVKLSTPPSAGRAKLMKPRTELSASISAGEALPDLANLLQKTSKQAVSWQGSSAAELGAGAAPLILEIARLKAAVEAEIAHRGRLDRELESAREVQEHLFPRRLQPIAGLDYSAACRQARAIGGDYYDFLNLPGGRLGFAVGDVSGKGIGAALMMANLQASLRAEAMHAPENLAAVVVCVNRLVCEASPTDRFATLFYGSFDPATRLLRYVNAGHNPPMIFRRVRNGCRIERLDTGGAVVGFLEAWRYEEGSVMLNSGDVLVVFTDGVVEAMNTLEEEWGEQRLSQVVKACDGFGPEEIIRGVMASIEAFASGAPRHDDMTLVVLRGI